MFHGVMMARSRRKRSAGGYPPPAKPVFKPYQRSYNRVTPPRALPPYRYGLSRLLSAPLALDHPAKARTVRPSIRTVLTDRDPRTETRRHLDVSRRAVFRSRTLVNPWEVLPEHSLHPRNFTCARRSIRREVLFAIGGTGKGSKSPRRHTADSKVRC